MPLIKIQLHQINSKVGDLEDNLARAISAIKEAKGIDLYIFPHFFLTGNALGNLTESPIFFNELESILKRLTQQTYSTAIITSIPTPNKTEEFIYISKGKLHNIKGVITINGIRIRLQEVPASPKTDIELILGKTPFTLTNTSRPRESGNTSLFHQIYLNNIGGQDEFVFAGESAVLGTEGKALAQMKGFQEDALDIIVEKKNSKISVTPLPLPSAIKSDNKTEAIYKTLVLGLRDYISKAGFKKAIIGLSGGIDSALVAIIAADALGGSNLRCVRLPSAFSSTHSLIDAEELSSRLGCTLNTIAITDLNNSFKQELSSLFKTTTPTPQDTTEENLQARIRGVLLMAMSNKFHELLLNTGNKSESAVGYATLYGDMCGGFSVLKDVYKTTVYKLSEWRNTHWVDWFYGPQEQVVSENILTKAPSAELKPNQKDSDSLPPYDMLDEILKQLIEQNKTFDEIVASGIDKATLVEVINLFYAAEYKRRQATPGIILSGDKKYPLTTTRTNLHPNNR